MFRMCEGSLRRNCRPRPRKAILALLAAGMSAVSGPAYAKGVRIGCILPTLQHIRFAFEARLVDDCARNGRADHVSHRGIHPQHEELRSST